MPGSGILGETKDRPEAVLATPTSGLSEAQSSPGVQHRMNFTTPPSKTHDLDADIAQCRAAYRRLLYERREPIGCGEEVAKSRKGASQ
jgi:hypothetical protein